MKSISEKIECYVDIIASIISGCNFNKYLELGIWNGANFKKIVEKCPTLDLAVGVDLKPLSEMVFSAVKPDNITIYDCTSTQVFFTKTSLIFDCIFIDACHRYANVIKDFECSLSILNEDGIIFLHDTYPPDTEHLQDGYCSDCYKAYFDIVKRNDVCECITLPTYCGLTIVRKRLAGKKLLTIDLAE